MLGNATPPLEIWPDHIREYATRHGMPEAVFTTANGGLRGEKKVGVLLLLVGVLSHAIFWTFLNPADVPAKFILLCLTAVPGLGTAVLIVARQNREIWVFVYPTGVLHWKRGVTNVFPWEEIRAVYFSGVHTFHLLKFQRDEGGDVIMAWLTVQKNMGLLWRLRLLRTDGVEAVIPGNFTDAVACSRLIQERVFRLFWAAARESLQSDYGLSYGPLRVSRAGVHDDRGDLVPWAEIGSVKTDGSLQIRKAGCRHPWRTFRIWKIPNPHVLFAILATEQEITL